MSQISITDWKTVGRGCLVASFTVELPSGIQIREMGFFTKPEAQGPPKKWVSGPARSYKTKDGTPAFAQLLAFRTREIGVKFSGEVLAAVDQFLLGIHP